MPPPSRRVPRSVPTRHFDVRLTRLSERFVLAIVLNAAEASDADPSGDSIHALYTVREAVRRGSSMMRELMTFAGENKMTLMRATPKGTVELRRLFIHGVKTESGETVARDGVLDRLRAMVDAEDKAHPLSDERLSDMLKGEGFPVARRTVAKYRALAGIPGTSERRV